MVNVTLESLAEKIKRLESRGNAEYSLGLTISEEYQLEAYRMLLAAMSQAKIIASWDGAEYYSSAVELYHSDGHEFELAIDKMAEILRVKSNG